MSLVFESDAFKANAGVTATHVLLVGCGEYPDLIRVGYDGLAPLTSPRVSLEAMVGWLLAGGDGMAPLAGLASDRAFYNPEAKLGTVDLLASPMDDYTTPSGQVRTIDRPTLANIRDAYRAWMVRLGTNPNSRGIFYFCGHGVGDGVDQVLIADDFGSDPDDVWQSTFHVSNTCQASIRKTPATLLFLVDACMEFNPDLLVQISLPQPLLPGKRTGEPLCTEWLVLRATTTNRLAYALPRESARFTKAVLQALQGCCGQQRAGEDALFDVTAAQLREATAAFLLRLQQPGEFRWQKMGTPQGEGTWNVPLHVLVSRPSVLVELDVEPQGFRPVAQVFVENAATPRQLKPLNGGPAQFVVPMGEWNYGATSGVGAFVERSYQRQLLARAVVTCNVPVG